MEQSKIDLAKEVANNIRKIIVRPPYDMEWLNANLETSIGGKKVILARKHIKNPDIFYTGNEGERYIESPLIYEISLDNERTMYQRLKVPYINFNFNGRLESISGNFRTHPFLVEAFDCDTILVDNFHLDPLRLLTSYTEEMYYFFNVFNELDGSVYDKISKIVDIFPSMFSSKPEFRNDLAEMRIKHTKLATFEDWTRIM